MRLNDRKLANWLLSVAVLLALLVAGRSLLVPLVFAALLWAILNSLTELLQRWGFPAWLAWLTAFGWIGAALYFVVSVLVGEAATFAAQIPGYVAKLQVIWASWTPFARQALNLEALLKQSNLPGILGGAVASLGNTLLEVALVAIYVGFLLAEQRYLPTKMARLQGNAAAENEGAQVIHAIGRQIRSYLGVCTFLSVVMGVICYVLLSALGVDFAGFWALLLFFLTYIPTIGGFGVVLPALMALAQFESFGSAIVIVVILGFAHFFLTDIVEPIMLGRSLNLSPFVIILSLTFWGLIWGIGGLFLAVPITGAIAIACRHIDGLGWISELIAGPAPHRHPLWRLPWTHRSSRRHRPRAS
jgi:predicted PurR-regulated permease PerM